MAAPAAQPALWLNAWHDPVASIFTVNSCIRVADVTGDGDPKLLIADQNRKLRMYKGMNLVSEHGLLDIPSAICTFYDDAKSQGPRLPSLAVACGPFIFIYKRLRPHYKFTLPGPKVDDVELAVWQGIIDGKVDTSIAFERLSALRDRGALITNQAIDFLGIEDSSKRDDFICSVRDKLPTHTTTITCMESLNKNSEDDGATSCLIVGTEHRQVAILDSTTFSIIVKAALPSVPVFLCTSGLLDVEYRVIAACRDGTLYIIKNGQLLGTRIELEAQPCGLILAGKNIVAGCTDDTLQAFQLKGKKVYSIHLPAHVQALQAMSVDKTDANALQLVALSTGQVRMYNEKQLVSVIECEDVVVAMHFGKYAREDGTLLLFFKGGGMAVKMLSRNAKLNKAAEAGPPKEQDIPLKVPKKTKLYVEQVQGLGPNYKLAVTLQNTGSKSVTGQSPACCY